MQCGKEVARQNTFPPHFGSHAFIFSEKRDLERRYSPSPKRSEINWFKASMTASASLPSATTSIAQPGAAASIINPMMELPQTVWPSLETLTRASNRSTNCTNFAEARACKPRLFWMISRSETEILVTESAFFLSASAHAFTRVHGSVCLRIIRRKAACLQC